MQRVANRGPEACFWPPLFLTVLLLISAADGDQLEAQTERNRGPYGAVDDASDALSPDDTLFAHLRCFERFASKQPDERERDVSDWLGADQLRYLHRTARTPPFLKCVLTKLGLYDTKEERFNSRILKQQFKKYKQFVSSSEECVELFVNETESVTLSSDSSEELYDAFELLFKTHSNAYFELFLREQSVLQKLYNQKELAVRKPNQTVIEFCELQMGEELWNDICQIRAYHISNRTDAMEAHIACIFRGFHYLTQDGFINEVEIVQDFAKAAVLTNTTELHIRECAERSSKDTSIIKRCLRMYVCLLEGASKEQFKEAFDFREIRSGNLTFLLQNLPYDRYQVKHQIVVLDMERCDDQQRPTGRITRY